MDLVIAARKGDLESVRLLVEQGADKDMFDSDGYTPLVIGSLHGNLDVVKFLVEQGAILDKTTSV